MDKVALTLSENEVKYPNKNYYFSPSENYPEYSGTVIAKEENNVYAMVRKCFYLMEYDKEHFGTPRWNPLGKYIKPGQTILLKPNWVEHVNKNEKYRDNMECLVTHPSVVRAIIDYVLVALDGKGKIIVADAPMQSCDLEQLFKKTGYDVLFEYYKDKGNIIVADMRKYSVENVARSVLSKKNMTKNSVGSVCVDLKELSMHSEKDKSNPRYKVSDYAEKETQQYHGNGSHTYEINRYVLDADVIINIPKPKTHRLAGMTAAMKNLVGITYEKACLPHRIEDSPERGGTLI